MQLLTISIGIVIYWVFAVSATYAETMTNNDYLLELHNPPDIQNLSTPTPVIALPKEKLHEQPVLIVGFNSTKIYSLLLFSSNNSVIDFGDISPTSSQLRRITINVEGNSSIGFSILGFENDYMKGKEGERITLVPDTSCDNGLCTSHRATPWHSPLTYGFGYHCENLSNTLCLPDFLKNNYRPFANITHKNLANLIGYTQPTITFSNFSLVYKLNIPPSQQRIPYQNETTLVVLPKF